MIPDLGQKTSDEEVALGRKVAKSLREAKRMSPFLVDPISFVRRPSLPNSSEAQDEQPTKPTHSRSAHQFYSPSPASSNASSPPSKQILPCGCSRSHVLMSQLERPVEADQETSKSLKREGDDFKFNYYLPHLSDRNIDFYAEQIQSPRHMLDDRAFEMDSAVELGLPYIDEGDFEYYPRSDRSSSPSSRGSESESSDVDDTYTQVRSGGGYAGEKKQTWCLRFLRSLRKVIRRSPGFF
ncbi:uncharacterized protein BDZ99DRAFT_575738 [Mytilinidion resinicola]|uniref:Uncharacterized protein n=1 Tax=Mytilinidion resinicola TaxID=574789 RepID=A0A6A6Y7D1_9PEZI|nr:uncharacterized protein BDZ99DRAFT_575738 [Mytilinidion resinicola]KAF2804095.1 hypothetical protein BDZ99DRAFT_575738 [Mytilinidion resinicola]